MIFTGEDRQSIENMIYYDADISRQQAAQVCDFGERHSFLIRARKGAGDYSSAPFVNGVETKLNLIILFLKLHLFDPIVKQWPSKAATPSTMQR